MSKSSKPSFNSWDESPVWVMLSPPEGLWEKAKVIKHIPSETSGEVWTFTIELESGVCHDVKTSAIDKMNLEFEWVKKRDPNSEGHVNTLDMTSLTHLNEPEMIECMRVRFGAKKIYTDTGPILMAMNPFERLPIYTTEMFQKYYNAQADSKLEPHVYKMSERAYRKMFVDRFDPDKRENQTVLVNGESGAGKTEATKQVLKYLSMVSGEVANKIGMGAQSGDVEKQIVSSNPITESFGNAKTSRNNNSSRFGKFIELGYSPDGYIEGAKIRTYLLETVRIAKQFKGERNYHIFYEIDAGLPAKQKAEYGLTSLKDFFYTNQSGEYNRHDDENDFDNYSRLRDAMTTLKIPDHFQELIVKILVGILHIGNITFTESASAGEEAAGFSATSENNVKHVCSLMGFSVDSFLTAVARRSVTVAGSEIQKVLNAEAAAFARDTFAKLIYDLLFKWTISQVNVALTANVDGESTSFIGVLDIFGFEFFAKNSFEQLCINYTNEKLQDHFNYAIFKSEQEVYKEEGLKWSFVDYPDNSARLELLENKTIGIYALCDEQLKVPKCSDEKFAKTLYDKCGKHKFFSASKSEQAKYEFTIKHFACDVKYQAEGFLDKNRSDIAKELNDCLMKSDNELIRLLALFDESGSKPSTTVKSKPGATIGKKASATVAAAFSKQLTDLVAKIRTTRSHFIRCIKPNSELKPNIFNQTMVLKQLRCGGALGAVQVFRAGFPNRMDFQSFVMKFGCCSYACGKNAMTKDFERFLKEARRTGSERAWMQAASRLVDVVPISENVLDMLDTLQNPIAVNTKAGLQMGKSQIFMRAEVFENMERLHYRTVNLVASRMQFRYRSWKLSKKNGGSKKGALKDAYVLFAEHKRENACRLIRNTINLQRRAKVYLAMRYRKRIIGLVTSLAALYRGWKARELVKRIRSEKLARLLQPLVRGWLTRLAIARRKRAEEEAKLRAEGKPIPVAAPVEVRREPVVKSTPAKVEKKVVAPPPPPVPQVSSEEVKKLELKIKEIEQENQQLSLLKDKITSLEAEKARETEQYQVNSQESQKYISDLQVQIKKLQDDVLSAQSQASLLEVEKKNATTENTAQLTIIANLRSELVTMTESNKLSKAELDEANATITKVKSQLSSIEDQKNATQGEVDHLKLRITTLQGQLSAAEEERRCARAEVAHAKADTSNVKETVDILEKELNSLREEVIRMKVEESSLNTQIAVMEEERGLTKSSAASARIELASIKTAKAVLDDEILALRQELVNVKNELSEMDSKYRNSSKDLTSCREEIEKLKNELTVQKRHTVLVEEEKANALAAVMQARAECASVQSQLSIVEQERNEARIQLAHAKAGVTSMQTSLSEAIQAKTTASAKEILKLKDLVSSLEEERDQLRAESYKANQQVTWIQSQMQSVLDAYKSKSQSELEVARRQVEVLDAQVMTLEARLSQQQYHHPNISSVASPIAIRSPSRDFDGYWTDNHHSINNISLESMLVKETSEQIEYLKSQIIQLGEQRDKAMMLVASLRSKMTDGAGLEELRNKKRAGFSPIVDMKKAPRTSSNSRPNWKK